MRVHQGADQAGRPDPGADRPHLRPPTKLLVRLYFHKGSLPLSQLGRQLQIHQTSITSLVDRLEKQGLIKRTPHPTDRRSILAEMTPAGRVLTRKAIKLLNSELFRDLGPHRPGGAPAYRPADEDAPLLETTSRTPRAGSRSRPAWTPRWLTSRRESRLHGVHRPLPAATDTRPGRRTPARTLCRFAVLPRPCIPTGQFIAARSN